MRRLAERMTLIVIPRPPKRAFERLERTAGKLARYVLRGEDDGNVIFLPDLDSAVGVSTEGCSGTLAQRLRIVNCDPVVLIHRDVFAMLVGRDYLVDAFTRRSDQVCEIALRETQRYEDLAIGGAPAIELRKGEHLTRDASLDVLRDERFDLLIGQTQATAEEDK